MNRKLAQIAAAFAATVLMGVSPTVPAQTKSCTTCGVVESIRYVEEGGKTSGLGMLGGAVVGGVIGHQIGSGRGNTAATVVGAAGGAYAGNQIEKRKKQKSYYVVTVKLDNGKTQTVSTSSAPTVNEGERVKIVDGNRLALIAR